MERDDFESLILKATVEAEVKRMSMNKTKAEVNEESNWSELEATFKAMLYHQFLEHSVDYSIISMENSPNAKDNKEIKSKKVDIWIEDKKFTYLLEVKMIDIRRRSGTLRRVYNKGGLFQDLLKLNKILEYFDNRNYFGIAIAVYNGHDNALDCDHIKNKLDNNIKEQLNRHLKMVICANGSCEYVMDGLIKRCGVK